jgi:hypothetical protein
MPGDVRIDPFAKPKRVSLPRNESEADPGAGVGELCLVFLRYAEGHYDKNGKPTSELSVLKTVIRPLNELYGMLDVRAVRSARLACSGLIFSGSPVGESSCAVLTAQHGIGTAMPEPHFTTRRIDSPCLFSSSSGAHTAAPEFHFWQLGGGCRAFFVINTAESPSWIA